MFMDHFTALQNGKKSWSGRGNLDRNVISTTSVPIAIVCLSLGLNTGRMQLRAREDSKELKKYCFRYLGRADRKINKDKRRRRRRSRRKEDNQKT